MNTIQTIITNNLFKRTLFLLLCVTFALGACRRSSQPASPNEPNVSQEPNRIETDVSKEIPQMETSLFDGKTLGLWKVTDFGGQGDVYVKDGAIYLETGSDMTGITWNGPLVRMNYEITLEAMRVDGSDIFCGLTFPVADNPCSLILGGWGGGVCGLSNIDYYDAANNETSQFLSFEDGQWYRVRLRVTPNRIEAWLDDEDLVNIETTGRKIDIRSEMDLSQPLGIATWCTSGAVRDIHMKPIQN